MNLKNNQRGRIKEYAKHFGNEVEYHEGKRPWEKSMDVALPSATQNEINDKEAEILVNNGLIAIGEGANMPSTPGAVDMFLKNEIIFGAAKAANAGGVATSGLEMSQNSLRLSWTRDEVDKRLHNIMINIYENASSTAKKYETDLLSGINIAGFLKVANSMIDQGHLS
jgi:glutamate dehydrogenase (NADP+)